VVNGHISNPRYRLMPLPAARLVVRRRYLAVVPRPLPAAPLVVRRKYLIVVPKQLPVAPLIVCRRYLIVVPSPLPAAQLVASRRNLVVGPRPLPRCASRGLDRGAQAADRGAARCVSQVLDHGAQAVSRGAATLPQQEEGDSEDVQRSRLCFTRLYLNSGMVALAAINLRRVRVVGRSFAAALTNFQPLLRRLRLRQKSRRGPPAAMPGAGD
jgi:hypothetical protein